MCEPTLVAGHRAGHALLPELRVPGPAAREPRSLRVARRDGHSRPVVRAHHAARRRRPRSRRGRPLRPRGRRSSSELERLAEKSAESLVAAIAASKAQPLSRLLFALGIKDIGETVAEADRPAFRYDGRDRRGDRSTTSSRYTASARRSPSRSYHGSLMPRPVPSSSGFVTRVSLSMSRAHKPVVPSKDARSSLQGPFRRCRASRPLRSSRRTEAASRTACRRKPASSSSAKTRAASWKKRGRSGSKRSTKPSSYVALAAKPRRPRCQLHSTCRETH